MSWPKLGHQFVSGVCVFLLMSSRDVLIDLVLNKFNEYKFMLHGKFNGFPEEEINTASEFGIRIQILYTVSSKSVANHLTKLK